MSKLSLTVALDPYEHAIDLLTGRVMAEGIDINWLRIGAAPVSHRFADGREFDVAELPLADYLGRVARGDDSVVAIPIFLSRQFVQGALWIRDGSKFRQPADLAGDGVRWACDDESLALYLRHWLGGSPGARAVVLETSALHAKLMAGELDAALSLSRPPAGKSALKRLIEDVPEAESAYYRTSKVFPILRVLCLQRDLAERHRWLPASLFEGFDRAKRESLGRLIGAGMSRYPLPWLNAYVLRVRTLFGDDIWPYGLAANRPTLDAFLAIARGQGICSPSLAVEDLFYPVTAP